MGRNTLATSRTTWRDMDLAFSSGMMARDTKECGLIIERKDEASFGTLMGIYMMESGKTTKQVGMVSTYI